MTYESDFNKFRTNYYASHNLNFQASNSPATLEIMNSLGSEAIDTEIFCTGNTGMILVELGFYDPANPLVARFGDQFPILNDEIRQLSGFKLSAIRITHSGTDSGYVILAR